jgi:hypothetical protein
MLGISEGMTVLPDLVRRGKVDHLVHGFADLHLDIISLANNTDIDPTQLTQQIKWWLWLLTQSQPKAVFLTALFDRRFNVLGHTIKPVCRTRTIDPLMRTLMVVISHPMV